jgi:hypothetical protein
VLIVVAANDNDVASYKVVLQFFNRAAKVEAKCNKRLSFGTRLGEIGEKFDRNL